MTRVVTIAEVHEAVEGARNVVNVVYFLRMPVTPVIR